MTKSDAVIYFGSTTELAAVLGVGKSAVSNWGDYPPAGRQIQIQYITDGFLRCEPNITLTETSLERKRRRAAFRLHKKRTHSRVAA